MSHRSCDVRENGSVTHPIREIRRGGIFTDYYFGEANTANKSDNYHNNATNENFNWGGFPGCYRVARYLDRKRKSWSYETLISRTLPLLK